MTCARPDQRKAPRRAFAAGASFHVYIVNSRAHIQEQGITGPGGCQPPFPVNMKNKFAQPSARRARPAGGRFTATRPARGRDALAACPAGGITCPAGRTRGSPHTLAGNPITRPAKDDSPPPDQPGGGIPPPHAPPIPSPAQRVGRAARLKRSRGIPAPTRPTGGRFTATRPARERDAPAACPAGGIACPAGRTRGSPQTLAGDPITHPAKDDSPPPDQPGGGTPSPHAPPVASPARRVERAARLKRSRGIPAPTRPTGGRFTAAQPARGRDALAACPAGGITCPAGRTRGMPFTQEGQPCARPCRPIGARGGMGLSSLRKARRPSRAGLPRIRIYEIL